MTRHGLSDFQRLVALGVAAADGQVIEPTLEIDASGRPRRGARARDAYPERMARILNAYEAELDGNRQLARSCMEEAELDLPPRGGDLADALMRTFAPLNGQTSAAFQEAFRVSAAELADLRGLRPVQLRKVILHKLCCLSGLRRNNFGRLFDATATADTPDRLYLDLLSQRMNEGVETAAGDDPDVPAGFIFLAQFIDHDITFDASSRLGLDFEPNEVLNLRTPALDLDNVYGQGPEGSPELYDGARAADGEPSVYLKVGPNGADLQRNEVDRTAIIGDPRNDENTLVSQLHLNMLHFHNAVQRLVRSGTVNAVWGRKADELPDAIGDFEFARRLVRWHYQWIVVHEVLPKLIAPTPLDAAHAIVGVGRNGGPAPALPVGYAGAKAALDKAVTVDCCGKLRCRPIMPVEFSAAAFRFAHSMVRGRYDLNDQRLDVPLFNPVAAGLASFGEVPEQDLVDWSRLFVLDGSSPQLARRIDTLMTSQVFALPFAPGAPSLPLRNLERGSRTFRLPTGEAAANAWNLVTGMSAQAQAQVDAARLDYVAQKTQPGFPPPPPPPANATPLWFFVLGEAAANGNKLGPLGGLIVAQTLLRLLLCDPSSYVNDPAGPWTPVLAQDKPGAFTLEDLLKTARSERSDQYPGA